MSIDDDPMAQAESMVEMIYSHYSDRLSTWEEGFIESLEVQLKAKKYLSEKQKAKLDDIFERVSNGGRSGGKSSGGGR